LSKIFINGLKLGLTIIGTTIGAGFASGRELWEFFSSYGLQSIEGILIAMSLFALSSILIVWISYTNKTENYYQVLVLLMGRRLAKIFDGFIFLYLFSGSIIMFAGSGATFEQWELPFFMGVIILAIATWLVIIRGVNGIMSLNSVLVPFLIIIILYTTFQYIISHPSLSGHYINNHLKVWPSAVTYSALNVVSLLGVLSTMGGKVNSIKEIIVGGLLAGGGLGIVAILLNLSLLRVEFVQQYEIPLFSLVPIGNSFLLIAVTIILWLAIYTTAIGNIHGLVHRIGSKWKHSTSTLSILIILAMLPLTLIGFSTLVKILYPLYGVLNLYLLAVLILYPFQTSK